MTFHRTFGSCWISTWLLHIHGTCKFKQRTLNHKSPATINKQIASTTANSCTHSPSYISYCQVSTTSYILVSPKRNPLDKNKPTGSSRANKVGGSACCLQSAACLSCTRGSYIVDGRRLQKWVGLESTQWSPAQHLSSRERNMAELDTNYIIVIVLVSIVLLLLVTIIVAALLLVYRRRMWCFKRRLNQTRLLQNDLERYGPSRKKRKYDKAFGGKKHKKRKHKKHRNKGKYHSLGRVPRFPKSDPFSNKFLENPLIADDDFDVDWTNPAFDSEEARVFDATITIQSWYRMIRYLLL